MIKKNESGKYQIFNYKGELKYNDEFETFEDAEHGAMLIEYKRERKAIARDLRYPTKINKEIDAAKSEAEVNQILKKYRSA